MEIPSVPATGVPADAFLLDVREDDEWAAGRVPGALHVPMNTVPSRLDEVPKDRDVYVICRAGARSGQVVGYLRQLGWTSAHNVDGGMQAWAEAGRPMEATGDAAPRVI